MAYNMGVEVKKIKAAFESVKQDMLFLRDENNMLKEELAYLKARIESNRSDIEKNKKGLDGVEKKEIVGNSDSKKYHYSDCPFAKKINKENKVVFKDIADAVKQGFDECPCIREI